MDKFRESFLIFILMKLFSTSDYWTSTSQHSRPCPWNPRHFLGFPGGSVGKEYACNMGDLGLIPGLGRSSREGNGNPLQYSCLENPVDRGTWWL